MGALDGSLGLLFVGTIIAAALWGISCAQTWHYYVNWPRDPTWLKCLVGAALIADTVHQGLITQSLYDWTVTNFGSIEHLEHVPSTAAAQVAFTEVITLIVQFFYVSRIWRLSQHRLLFVAPIVVITLAHFALAIVDMNMIAHEETFAQNLEQTAPLLRPVFALMFLADVLVAGAMCVVLRANRGVYASTNGIITRILVFTLGTNLLTSLCALSILILEAVRPRALLYMPLFQNIGRVYTNSFLAALNLRTYFAAGARADHGAGARAGRGAGASAAPDSFVLPQFVAREAIETDAGDAGASVGELGTAEDGAKPVF